MDYKMQNANILIGASAVLNFVFHSMHDGSRSPFAFITFELEDYRILYVTFNRATNNAMSYS